MDGLSAADRQGVVHVVDDDRELREYVRFLLEGAGWRTEVYEDAGAFLDAYRDEGPACLLTDLCMPGLSGLDLQAELAARGYDLPLIMMSAQGEVRTAVQAMRAGAVDFLEKPFEPRRLLDLVERGMAAARAGDERRRVRARYDRLTPRQRAVLDGLVAGKPSKIIAADLGLSPRTVDVHRFRIMQTMEADSLPELFRMLVMLRSC